MEHHRDYIPEPPHAEVAGTMQEKVNATLEELQPEIDRVNLTIEQSWGESPEQARRYLMEAIQYLDGEWGYTGHSFFVTGSWNGPKVSFDEETKKFSFVGVHHEAFDTVQSEGFFAYQLTGHTPRVGLLFQSEPEGIETPMIAGNFVKRYIADPREVTLQHMHPTLEEAEGVSLEMLATGIHEADSALKGELANRESEFYTKSADEQYATISSVVDSVNDLMPSPNSGQMLLTDTSASMIYLQHQRGERLAPVSLKRQEIEIVGKVEGVTTYDMVVNAGGDKQFLEPGQCETARSGLMLVMSEYASNLSLDDEGDPGVVLIPLGRTSKLALSIEEE